MEALSWWWNHSIEPLTIRDGKMCGQYVFGRLDPSNCINCCQSRDSNCVLQSVHVVIVDGMPNLAIQPLRKA